MSPKFVRHPQWARVTSAGSDDGQFAVQQVKYLGKTADSLMVFPYGIHGNVPPDALALMFAVQGNPENRASIAWTPKNRPQLAAGEVAFYHPLLPDLIIKLQANGKALIKSGIELELDAPLATFSGNVKIDGTLEVAGQTTLKDVTSNTKDIGDTHGHTQGNDSDGDTQAVISGVT